MAEIPHRIEQFVEKYIFSVSEFQILLYLRDPRAQPCDSRSIAAAFRLNASAVEAKLKALCRAGLVTAQQTKQGCDYLYSPSSELAALVTELPGWFATHPVSVTTLIFSKPIDRGSGGF